MQRRAAWHVAPTEATPQLVLGKLGPRTVVEELGTVLPPDKGRTRPGYNKASNTVRENSGHGQRRTGAPRVTSSAGHDRALLARLHPGTARTAPSTETNLPISEHPFPPRPRAPKMHKTYKQREFHALFIAVRWNSLSSLGNHTSVSACACLVQPHHSLPHCLSPFNTDPSMAP